MHASAMPGVFFHVSCMSADTWQRKYSMLFGQCQIFIGVNALSWQKLCIKYVSGLLQQNHGVGSDVAFDDVSLIMCKKHIILKYADLVVLDMPMLSSFQQYVQKVSPCLLEHMSFLHLGPTYVVSILPLMRLRLAVWFCSIVHDEHASHFASG
jgi:hypothetical protein